MSPARYFLDTSVLAYALDAHDPRKMEIAQHLIEAHSGQIAISTQVLIELYSVCTGKLAMSKDRAAGAVRLASGLDVVPADRALIVQAASLAGEAKLSIFDAAIVCAAARAECDQILTEDAALSRGAGSIAVVDPFSN